MQPQPATLPLPQFSQINIQQLKQDILDLIQRGLNLLAQVQTPQDFQHSLNTVEQFDEFENQFRRNGRSHRRHRRGQVNARSADTQIVRRKLRQRQGGRTRRQRIFAQTFAR